MKTRILNAFIVVSMLAIPLAVMSGCAQEISHTETDKPGWFGGRKHEETTVYRNPDGTTSVQTERTTTK